MSECAGDLERGSIRNLKINALSARKSMGLIGMPIGPVKTIKREEKCLTTAALLLTQTQGREKRRPKEKYQRQTERDEME